MISSFRNISDPLKFSGNQLNITYKIYIDEFSKQSTIME